MKSILRLEKLAGKAGVSLEVARKAIAYHHELENFVPKSQLTEINLNLDQKSARFVEKIAKTLKISESAVVGAAIVDTLQREGKLND